MGLLLLKLAGDLPQALVHGILAGFDIAKEFAYEPQGIQSQGDADDEQYEIHFVSPWKTKTGERVGSPVWNCVGLI
jgi:hypothetical protein